MFDARQDLAFGGTLGSEFIRLDDPRHVARVPQPLAKEALGRLCVAAALNQYIEHFAVRINGSPALAQFAADPDEPLIQEPFVAGLRSAPLEALGVSPPEAQAPRADGLVADYNTPRPED